MPDKRPNESGPPSSKVRPPQSEAPQLSQQQQLQGRLLPEQYPGQPIEDRYDTARPGRAELERMASSVEAEELNRFNAVTELLAKDNRLHDDRNMRLMSKILSGLKKENTQSLTLLSIMIEDGKLLDFLHFYVMGKVDLEALEGFRGSNQTAKHEKSAIAVSSKPMEPPSGQLYAARTDRKETAPEFINRVYGGAGWLSGEFTRADLRKVDPQAIAELTNYESYRGSKIPLTELNLPTVEERNNHLIASGASVEIRGDRKETQRRRSMVRRRAKPAPSTGL